MQFMAMILQLLMLDEGMSAGESFILRIWDSSTGDVLEYPTSFDCWYNNNVVP
jgi:hypothetical protein